MENAHLILRADADTQKRRGQGMAREVADQNLVPREKVIGRLGHQRSDFTAGVFWLNKDEIRLGLVGKPTQSPPLRDIVVPRATNLSDNPGVIVLIRECGQSSHLGKSTNIIAIAHPIEQVVDVTSSTTNIPGNEAKICSISALLKPTPVGALGEVRKNIRAVEAAISASGRRMDRSKSITETAPSCTPTSTGYSE